ncbi:MAG: response regulator [bacterium]
MMTKGRIVVVDYDDCAQRALVEILEDEGYDAICARTGEEALRIVSQQGADLVLMEVLLPGMSGFETCKRLKGDDELPPMPVCFLSNKNDIETKLRGFLNGGSRYITKPIDPSHLLDTIRSVIGS